MFTLRRRDAFAEIQLEKVTETPSCASCDARNNCI